MSIKLQVPHSDRLIRTPSQKFSA